MRSPRSAGGQASVDYVAALALVAVVFGLAAAAVGAPWLAPRLAQAIRHGICVVSGSLCTPGDAARAGLDPCAIHRRTEAERAGATAVLRIGRGDSMVVERFSDGRARITFVDGAEAGVEGGVGAKLPTGPSGEARVGVGVAFNRGRVYEFESWRDAGRFLARYADEETLSGEGRRLLRELCWRCPAAIEGRGIELPEPDARFVEGGSYADLTAQAGVEVPSGGRPVEAEAELRASEVEVLGRRRAGRRTTWYLRLDGAVSAELGAIVASLTAAGQGEAVLELTLSEAGRPVLARVRAAAALGAEVELAGLSLDAGELADRLRAAAAEPAEIGAAGGAGVEVAVALDLTDPANANAVRSALIPGGSAFARAQRLAALGRRLDVDGAVDVRTYRTTRSSDEEEMGAGDVLYVGAGYARTESTRALISAWSGRPRDLRRREDCEEAAREAATA